MSQRNSTSKRIDVCGVETEDLIKAVWISIAKLRENLGVRIYENVSQQ